MSKCNNNIKKKDEVEMEKLETGTCMDKSGISGILSKSKKEDVLDSKSLQYKHSPEIEIDNKSSISNKVSLKTQELKKFKKLNSEKIFNYFSFNNNIIKSSTVNSDQERFHKTILKDNLMENGNAIKRIREFAPAKEYIALFEELDEEETNHEIKNDSIYEESKIIPEINNNCENRNIKKEDNNIEEQILKEKIKENIKKEENINENIEENNKIDNNEVKPKNCDINNIDINEDSYKKEIDQKINDLLKENENFFYNTKKRYIAEQKSYEFDNIMKERDKKFKEEYRNNFSVYYTDIFFKYGEYSENINEYQNCILLIKKHFLYVLCNDSIGITNETIKFFNPDISLINILEKNENITKNTGNNYLLKNKFNISSPLLCINFNLLSCILLINKNNIREFQIMILGTKNKYSFIIDKKDIFNKFIFLIQNLIRNTSGSRKNKLGLSLRNNIFYKDTYISYKEIEYIAKSGDLLLFRTMDKCADCQRLYTCDQYDHVGIIIIDNNSIKIFESTSMGKCNTISWKHFIHFLFNLVYYKITYRKLNYENNDIQKKIQNQKDLQDKCKSFLDEIQGKDYYLSIPNFICCKKPENYEFKNDWNKAKGFCCSALAAAFYIKIGVVKLEKSVHSTRPGDFEQDKNRLTFENGYSLGPEKIIEFSE